MPERRYTDEEIEQIFARASEAEPDAPRRLQSGGRTLSELQSIGREAGIAPELVARAARDLDQPVQPAPRRFLGLPLTVARTVHLRRRLTDAEWERLVVQLRETFDARGVTRSEGSFRQWTNGNLQVLVEPDGEGHRVRFRTLHGQARALMLAGAGIVAAAVATWLAAVLANAGLTEAMASAGSMALIGAATFGIGALRLPGWSRLRQRQMDELSDRLAQLPEAGAG